MGLGDAEAPMLEAYTILDALSGGRATLGLGAAWY